MLPQRSVREEATEAFKAFKAEETRNNDELCMGEMRELCDSWDGGSWLYARWTAITIRVGLVRSGIEGRLVILRLSHRSLDFGVDVAMIECGSRAAE